MNWDKTTIILPPGREPRPLMLAPMMVQLPIQPHVEGRNGAVQTPGP
ncbi:hypothetical protein CSC43_6859 [Pseudomonas aeruginosa]|nr:hypothetical protein CSC43_6859 [Pseudomonas aeruginosa]